MAGSNKANVGKYDPWEGFFAGIEGDDVTFTFSELEAVLGQPLPPSASIHPAWWSSGQPHAVWVSHGFVASPDFHGKRVRFRRIRDAQQRSSQSPASPIPERNQGPSAPEGPRLILLGCVSEKRDVSNPAKDLYVSDLWRKRRSYAEASGQPWRILSAEYGLVDPDQVIEPYDRALAREPRIYRRRWSRQAADEVTTLLQTIGMQRVEVHAGAPYVESGLKQRLEGAGVEVLWPLRGLRFGEQKSWYLNIPSPQARRSPADQPRLPETRGPEASRQDVATADVVLPLLQSATKVGEFTYRWPDAIEGFEYGWEGEVEWMGERVSFRHGVGGREVYGRWRIHTVAFLGGVPVVEGVACDDWDRSRALVSQLKHPDGTLIRERHEVDPGYGAYAVVDHRGEIESPYSRSGMAVKLRVDDLVAWVHHALIRRDSRRRRRASTEPRRQSEPDADLAKSLDPLDVDRKRAIGRRLVEFSDAARSEISSTAGMLEFTDNPEANELLASDPFAFLLGVVCDQGIKAERAWAIPMELKRRLGHLDPKRIAGDLEGVRRAFAGPPALHRYVENVPRWVVSAAHRVMDPYGGDASSIWSDQPTAAELQQRLQAFDGIGQKKAAMAVEMLERDLGVDVRRMEGSDIAYDVHVRRVFIRTGLADRDDQDHMVAVARQVYPERPGELDLSAWVIGRKWCRPGMPDCPACVLDDICDHRIEAGNEVQGV